jgi:addiction module RelE/StbE family toxin
MQIIFRKSFQKDFAKCPLKIQAQTEERVALFIADRFNPLLNFHALKGEYDDCFSINVNADARVIFHVFADTMHLIRIGSHSQLY